MSNTHLTAVTRYVDFKGDRFAYRRWGNTATSQPPLLLVQHFRGGMDHSDPLMTDGLAQDRKVILFNGIGIICLGGKAANTLKPAIGSVMPSAHV